MVIVIDPCAPSSAGSSVIAAARTHGIPIVHASGAVASPMDAPAPHGHGHEHEVRRRRLSAFFGTDLAILLGDLGASTLILVGGETSVSVHYTFVDAHQHDFFCRVAEDTMSASSEAAHEGALRAMEYMQTGARRRGTELIAAFAEQVTP